MSRFHGPAFKGARKTVREIKRREAGERDERTPEERRRKNRQQQEERER